MASTTRSRIDVIQYYYEALAKSNDEKSVSEETASHFKIGIGSLRRYLRDAKFLLGQKATGDISQTRSVDGGKCVIHSWKSLAKPTAAELWESCVTENQKRAFDEEASRYLTIDFPEPLPVGVTYLADAHVDDPRARLDLAERDAKIVATCDGMHIAHGGDPLNNYLKQRERYPRFDDPKMSVHGGHLLFEHWFSMTVQKALFACAGNHDYFEYGLAGIFKARDVCDDSNIHYSKDELIATFNIGSESFLGYFTHTFWGTSRLNPVHEILRAARHCPTERKPDIVGVGHRHDSFCGVLPIDGRQVIGVKSGSYKPNAADFEGQASIPHAITDMPVIIFLPDDPCPIPIPSIERGAEILTDMRERYLHRA